jgi:hypothetical protein
MVIGLVYDSHVVPSVLIYVPLMPHVSVAVTVTSTELIKTSPHTAPLVVKLTVGGVVSDGMIPVHARLQYHGCPLFAPLSHVSPTSLVPSALRRMNLFAVAQLYVVKYHPATILPSLCTTRAYT